MKSAIIGLAALAAMGTSCASTDCSKRNGLEYDTQNNGLVVPKYSAADAKTKMIEIQGYKISLSEIDRNNDKKADLMEYSVKDKNGKIVMKSLFEDSNLDGTVELAYSDIFDGKMEQNPDGSYDMVVDIKLEYLARVKKMPSAEDLKLESLIKKVLPEKAPEQPAEKK